MAMDKHRNPDEEERRIIERNGIDLSKVSVVVTGRTKEVIFLKVHKTGDEMTFEPGKDEDKITIRQGFKPWESY